MSDVQSVQFSDFDLPEKLLQSLKRMEFKSPMPIQEKAIPLVLQGKDIIGSAQTGTGKTGAFGIPVVAKLMEDPEATALILTPTRELASQVSEAIQSMIPVPDIKAALLIGGDPMQKQIRQLDRNPRLIVGTPGRINDHLRRGRLKLDKVRFLILDETDRMLDMGFGIQIDDIIKHMPQKRQTLLFSATLPQKIVSLAKRYTDDAVRIAVGSTRAPAANVQQELVHTSDNEKFTQLMAQLEAREGSVIIFVKTKYSTERLAKRLCNQDYESDAIHGDLKQRRRDRVIQKFRDKKYRILVATDIAARGLDIPHIEHVINYDLPQCPEDYIHRIGRTARAGAKGHAVNLLTKADGAKWKAIHRLLNGNDNDMDDSKFDGPTKKHKVRRSGWKKNVNVKPSRFAKKKFGDRQEGDGSDRPFSKRKHNDEDKPFYKGKRNDEDKPFSKRKRNDDGKPSYKGKRSEDSNDRPKKKFGNKFNREENSGDSVDRRSWKKSDSSDSKPFNKAKRKPAGKSNGKPAGKTFGKSTGKPSGKPAGGKKRFGKSGPNKGSQGGNSQGGGQTRRRKAA